jgi:hypothetical protein
MRQYWELSALAAVTIFAGGQCSLGVRHWNRPWRLGLDEDFSQTSDEEVRDLLERVAQEQQQDAVTQTSWHGV